MSIVQTVIPEKLQLNLKDIGAQGVEESFLSCRIPGYLTLS